MILRTYGRCNTEYNFNIRVGSSGPEVYFSKTLNLLGTKRDVSTPSTDNGMIPSFSDYPLSLGYSCEKRSNITGRELLYLLKINYSTL